MAQASKYPVLTQGMLFLFAASWAMAPSAEASEYEIDSGHSNIGFTIRHLVSKVSGGFSNFNGKVRFDSKKPEEASVTADVTISSINTLQKKRDEHLLSEDFFAAKRHPKAHFVSKKVVSTGDKKYKMEGELTLLGVTKPVTFDVELLGEANGMQGEPRIGFTAVGKVSRKDFGMSWNKTLDAGNLVLGDEVTINLNIEAAGQKTKSKM